MAIVKILARHTPQYGSLIKYILNEGKVDKDEVYRNNLRTENLESIVTEFVENEAFRQVSRSDQVFLYHEIISFSAFEDEPVTKEMIDDLVSKYIEMRGENGVMIGAVHRNEKHVHAHFAVSALHYRTGKSFGMSKAQLFELKTQFQEYHKEKYPQLTKSFPEHGKGDRYKGHAAWHREQRVKIQETVKSCFAQAKTQSEFLDRLRSHDLHHYERRGKPTGIQVDGDKFRFSRLLDEGQALEQLPVETVEVEQALADIRAIRDRQQQREERDREEPGLERER